MQPPPVSLYVHLPWCVRKCPYCDFNSHGIGPGAVPDRAYLDALIRDVEQELPQLHGRRFQTIFFGGGTPSLFPAGAIGRLLEVLARHDAVAPGAEITLEANPGTAEARRFAGYHGLGINRLSLGMQSLDDASLRSLGRIHDSAEAIRAAAIAHAAGFTRINMDLMHGLPAQTPAAAMDDLRRLVALRPTHVSWYELTIEPNTAFYSAPPRLPDEDTIWDMRVLGQQQLRDAGFRQYEVSAWAAPGHECRHNINYWEFGDYLGIGAGAHGKLTDVERGTITRHARHRLPERYMKLAGTPAVVVRRQELAASDRVIEFMLNACRLTEGFALALFTARTGLDAEALAPGLRQAADRGLLAQGAGRVQPTEFGRCHLNDLLQWFLPEDRRVRATVQR
ncbi:MAG: radical SAM family heme chaperone HemW [Gammaproteobacteria bacterium]|nr:radical SAM family heme chaperone HemW [Gammaproteobacteria bacterium]